MDPTRKALYSFFELPFHERIEIAKKLNIFNELDLKLNHTEATKKWSKQIVKDKLIDQINNQIVNKPKTDSVSVTVPDFDYIKCPLNRYTFQVRNIKEWVEANCEGKTLNLFAGKTKLNIDEIRNDLDEEMLADFRMDAVEFLRTWKGEKFDTVLLDPPYAFRKSMEMYKGIKCSPFRQLKDEIKKVLKEGGKVITFGYHSNTMGEGRGFKVEKIALFSHGGAIHDTIASVERYIGLK